jgi:MFS transporter, PAT family, beta-lactamase induction signal transducer AmpG
VSAPLPSTTVEKPIDVHREPPTDVAARKLHPLAWVPTLYLAMGTPMITVSVVSAIMYKNLGLTNTEIALYTGSLYLPWVIKPLWAPLLELYGTTRRFVLMMEFTLAATLACTALALQLPHYVAITLALFWMTGFASATQDIAADGLYIAAMSPREQAQYVGVQGIFWNAARLIAAGAMVELTHMLHESYQLSWTSTWGVVMALLALLMLLLGGWHVRALPVSEPRPSELASVRDALATMADTWASFLRKKHIWMMLAVIFFYRFGEGFIEKIGPLFMMDARSTGGLGLDNAALGRINGSYATVGFLSGTLLGGLFAARLTLRRSFWLLALALNVPHFTYAYLSFAQPESQALIAAVVTLEKFGYGFGSVGHMLYMMQQVAPGRYRTAHYAFATGIMGLSMMLTGMLSGAVQEWLGYREFFILVLAASVPPVVLALLAPFSRVEDAANERELAAS